MIGLTPPQARALRAIVDFSGRAGRMPTYYELKACVGYAGKSGAYRVVRQLIERGHLTGFPGGYALPRLATQPMRFIEAGTREAGTPEPYLGRYPIRSHRTLAELWNEQDAGASTKPAGMTAPPALAQASPSAEWRTGETP